MKFTVIDKTTGAYPDAQKIALTEDWAKGLIYCDIDGFYISEDGELVLVDDCNNMACCPPDRFEVVESQQQEIERLKGAIKADIGIIEGERLENAQMREALQDAIDSIRNGYLSSIGGLHNTYSPQISVKTVERWEQVLSTTPIDHHNSADDDYPCTDKDCYDRGNYHVGCEACPKHKGGDGK